MADKPRVQAPKQRADTADGGRGKRAAIVGGVATLAGLILIGVLFSTTGGGGGGDIDEVAIRADVDAAGCELTAVKALPGEHTVTDPGGTSPEWNTDPPTNGPHYPVAAVFGSYNDELEQARVVHNLEHGGVYIQYGDKVPASTVDELRSFYEDNKAGTIMAPLARLGDQFALGAWVVHGDIEKGYVATCTEFDETAVSSFFDGFQFRGPEHFDPSALQPGH